jgi:hypothetical protein
MLSEAGVNWTSGCIVFHHLTQYFGKSIVASEKKGGLTLGAMISPLQLIKLSYQKKLLFHTGGSTWMSCFNTRSTT